MKNRYSTLFIQTPCYELMDDRLEPPLGLLYLATWLNRHGHEARVLDISSVPPHCWEQIIPQADVYGFSTYSTSFHRTLDILTLVKRINPSAVTVAGGPHATALPEGVKKHFDYVVMGEGEQAMLHLMESLEKGEEPPPILHGELVPNLDDIPFPDYSLVDVESYHRVVDGSSSLSVLSSRGCPYRCVFCNSIVLGRTGRMRFRSAENVWEEIHRLKTDLGVTSFRFQDDNFTLNRPRLREMTRLFEREEIRYRCFGRVDRCSREVTDLLFRGGCRHIAFGIESGSDAILRGMQKDQTTDDIRRGIFNAKASGLAVRVYLMVGFPGETWETVQSTVDLMLECLPDEFSVYPLIPYPGTPIYQQPEKFGITDINPDFSQYFQVRRGRESGYVFRTDSLDEEKIASMRQYVIEQLEPAITWAGDSKLNR
ncbi:MAG: radical SAM protein [Chloroflexi bacterium]|nr:radical SAM protein [Chloroflexota bacterium]